MKKLLELRALKAQKIEDSKKLLAIATTESRSLNTNEGSQLTELRSGIESLNGQIATVELIEAEERSLIGSTQGQSSNKPSKQELRSFINASEHEQRSLSIGVSADGGHTVVPHLDKQIAKQLRENVVMLANAKNVTISTQEYKELISVGGTSTSWAGEGDTRNETNTSKLEPVTIKVGNLYAYPSATNEVIDHSDFNLEEWLTSEISEEFATALETSCWNGDGVKKPKGILITTRSADADGVRSFGEIQEVTTAASATTSFDDLITLVHTLKPAYRKNAKFFMSDSMAEKLRKIKNGDGDYIWRSAVIENQSDLLLGKIVVISDEIPANEVVFSDMNKAYTVVSHSRGNVILRDQITNPGTTKLHVNNYFGGSARDTKAVKIMKEAI